MRDFLRTPGGEPLKHFRAEWSAQGFGAAQFHKYFPRIFAKVRGFPCGSAGKEFACNAGDLGLRSEAAGGTEAPGQQEGSISESSNSFFSSYVTLRN